MDPTVGVRDGGQYTRRPDLIGSASRRESAFNVLVLLRSRGKLFVRGPIRRRGRERVRDGLLEDVACEQTPQRLLFPRHAALGRLALRDVREIVPRKGVCCAEHPEGDIVCDDEYRHEGDADYVRREKLGIIA